MDDSGSIKFASELESNRNLPFLNLLIVEKEDGDVKPKVYRKPTHTDQYLNFNSHHPIEHKLSVVRTLVHRNQSLISEDDDRKHEDQHVKTVLRSCGYPDWTFKKVKGQMESAKEKKLNKKRQQSNPGDRPQLVILCQRRYRRQ